MPDQIFVLVAEDEELVRLVIVDALKDAGFEVMEAEHAAEALNVLKLHADRIHVLFTDIRMPGVMDGLALAHHTGEKLAQDRAASYLGPAPPASVEPP